MAANLTSKKGLSVRSLRIGLLSFFALLLVLIIFVVPNRRANRLEKFLRQGLIVKDSATLLFLDQYIRNELPKRAARQIALAGDSSGGVRLYIVRDSAGQGGFQPFNAFYDQTLDAVFVDSKLVRLAQMSNTAGGGRTLLSFVLLHELGHRKLHRHQERVNDFVSIASAPAWYHKLFRGFFSTGDSAAVRQMKRELEADRWAVDRILENLPSDSAGLFVNEPDSLPLLNLIEGGMLASISQYGPYSPILQGKEHPSLFSRVFQFFYALSQSPRLRPEDALFYATEAFRLQEFLRYLKSYLAGMILLAEGDIPLSGVKTGNRIWIESYRGKLYFADLPADLTGAAEPPHIRAVEVAATYPNSTQNHFLLEQQGALFYVSATDQATFRFDSSQKKWLPWVRTPTDQNVVGESGFYSIEFQPSRGQLIIHEVNLAAGRVEVRRVIDSRSLPPLEPYQVVIGSDSSYLFVQDYENNLLVYSLRSNQPRLMQSFSKVEAYELDGRGRYLQLKVEKQAPPPSGISYHIDRFDRAYRTDQHLNLTGVGPFGGAYDVFDLQENRFLYKDLMLGEEPVLNPSMAASSAPLSLLHSEYFLVLDQNGSIRMNDDKLRNAAPAFLFSHHRLPMAAAGIPYSRFVLLFNFSKKGSPASRQPITLHAIDL